MVKIYTKKGDKGTTTLYGYKSCALEGGRISKADPLMDAIGKSDDLQASIGVLKVCVNEYETGHPDIKILHEIQRKMCQMSSKLADTKGLLPDYDFSPKPLERRIDYMDAELPKLTEFLIPGVNMAEAHAHICRTICRDLERKLWKYSEDPEEFTQMKAYVNRLSDYFFQLARYLSPKETSYKVSKNRETEISHTP